MVADIFKSIKIISIIIDSKINNLISKYNVTFRQVKVLRYISKNENACQKELEEYFHLTAATLSGIISRLEQNNLIKRIQMEDKRRNNIIITENGLKLLDEVSVILKDIDSYILDSIDNKILEDLNVGLNLLLEKVEGIDDDKNSC